MASKEIHQDPWKQDQINLFNCEWEILSMIHDNLKIFSQNVRKNSLIVNTILETQSPFNIIFIQEPPYQDHWWWTLFYFLFSLYFILILILIFLFIEQLGLGFISHAVTSVTNWWRSHKTDHGTWENEVEGSGTKWCHTAWTTHASLILYAWSFRVGYTVAKHGLWVIVYKVDYFVLGTLSSFLVLLQYKSCFLT